MAGSFRTLGTIKIFVMTPAQTLNFQKSELSKFRCKNGQENLSDLSKVTVGLISQCIQSTFFEMFRDITVRNTYTSAQ